jgi:hypothetical protein
MKDKIVSQVVKKFQERSRLGISKYGTTLEGNKTDNFINHALEESMDFILYLTKVNEIIKELGYDTLEELVKETDLTFELFTLVHKVKDDKILGRKIRKMFS